MFIYRGERVSTSLVAILLILYKNNYYLYFYYTYNKTIFWCDTIAHTIKIIFKYINI